MHTYNWNDAGGKKCGQHCFWLNYRLLIFISSDFSITQLRKSVDKPGEREVLQLEIHLKLLPPLHSHPRTTTKGQLGFWPKVTMWTEICTIVPASSWRFTEMQGEHHIAPPGCYELQVGSGSLRIDLRQRAGKPGYGCRLQTQLTGHTFCQQSTCPLAPICMTLALFSCILLLTQ